MNTIEVPLTFVTAGLVGLGGLALLMGAALSSLAELLALMPGRGGWVGSGAKGSDVDDSQAGSVVSIVTEVRRPLSLHGEVSKPE